MSNTATNPDLRALGYVKEILSELRVEFPDGESAYFDDIDIGFMSTPTSYPYASLHTISSRAPVKSMGGGAGVNRRVFEIEAVIAVEYEHADPVIGFERLTQIRWDVMLALIQNVRKFPGVEFADFEEAYVQVYNVDDGSFEDWGFFGQILMPIKIRIPGGHL